MTDDTTVADDAKATAEAGAKDGGAQAQQDEVEKLLAEYRDSKAAQPAATEPKQEQKAEDSDISELRKEVQALKAERSRQNTQDGINDAVKAIKDDLGIPDRLVRGLLQDEAAQDERFTRAFLDRHDNPEAWSKILKGKAAQWKKELGELPDRNLTADREAIKASASRATGAPEKESKITAKELQAMTPEERDADYANWLSGG